MIKQILGILILVFLALSYFQKLFLIVFFLIIIYFLIRWGADIFWWGRDNEKW